VKVYLAGASTDTAYCLQAGATRALTSFAEPIGQREAVLGSFPDVLLDSGAFTAFTLGKPIKLADYCAYLIEKQPKHYFNLDVIGDHDATLANYKRMVDKGFNPIPVFGYGGDLKYLREYCAMTDYVALGGLVPVTRFKAKLARWLNHCWQFLSKQRQGDTLVRVHGLGVSSVWALERYPFYSVDSTTWLVGNKFKELILADGKRVRPNRKLQRTANAHALSAIAQADNHQSRAAMVRFNVGQLLETEKHVTRLWEHRGVKW
jgi:hypothetical protein